MTHLLGVERYVFKGTIVICRGKIVAWHREGYGTYACAKRTGR